MPSQSSTHRAAAFRELLSESGEDLDVLDGDRLVAQFTGIVNRGLDAAALEAGQVDFTERNMTHIEVLIEDLDGGDPPAVGMHFRDGRLVHHRISVARRTDVTLKYECHVEAEAT